MGISVDTFFLELNGQGTLQAQIQQMIAEGILSGRFHVGEKLPSSRKLAAHLGVSRITVTLAYTELLANDYLTAKGRSGYYVSHNAPVPPKYSPVQRGTESVDWDKALARRFLDSDVLPKPSDWRDYRYPFIYGQADRSLFDHANWRLCAVRALGHKDFDSLTGDYVDQDDPLLIEFIARHTLPRRGIAARPEEILITLGAQNALWLASRILLTHNRSAVIEDPCYYALRSLLNHWDCAVTPLSVDQNGLPPETIPDDADVIFTTPSHQSPTTATMPIARRNQLLDRARELDAMVVEDDYEFEMAFRGAPSPALKSMDRDGRVIYVGSFSKSLFPGLRLGYMVGSEPFIREARALRSLVLRHPPGHIQRTAAYFLSLGHYDAQIRRMSKALQERRDAMDSAIEESGLTVAGRGVIGGSSMWMSAPEHIDTTQLALRLQTQGVHIEPGAPFFSGPNRPQNYYRLGYSSISTDRIAPGVKLIADAIRTT
ncbi:MULTISPECIES: PLP-dependent aminotransferase family protein [unclassified Ruegeria]|uniref:MocR-like pyridoxine biosynthesis transcription factor PdxR n=1 Tax=unclassified Ruegeria TaxID=2625375 RepID=UPI001491269E|nr:MULTISPECIES: PLP-dependent aminotransferase family protein [unclassified Ruegeria]NOD90437.1 aminotransferase class I/II-fold pyridoxal phosphate-dependent enzyme [Ruegeria sp. HKCCD4318]NOE15509.1 aminotransferase class I/II-fold pyridoxal phosphate-dependent enzyme [Ruegeria sp. HKCCD4318-2]NOG10277.1 PLP-dependent aminotransferase family protein [Ruegeria sp. HKCCD4315]